MYFSGDAANAEDAVLSSVPSARRETLIAKPDRRPTGPRSMERGAARDR
jgi:protocatechuate 3,4-dioxygenase beta subunit